MGTVAPAGGGIATRVALLLGLLTFTAVALVSSHTLSLNGVGGPGGLLPAATAPSATTAVGGPALASSPVNDRSCTSDDGGHEIQADCVVVVAGQAGLAPDAEPTAFADPPVPRVASVTSGWAANRFGGAWRLAPPVLRI